MKKISFSPGFLFAFGICFLFFLVYATLGIVRQLHFLSGYDLAIADQIVWQYSHGKLALTTIEPYTFTPILWDHVELIYILLSPFYLLFASPLTLIVLQAFAICSSGFAIYLIAKKYSLKTLLAISLLISYLMFYGIQNAIWADVHSLVFGVSFLAWFIYFLEKKSIKLSFLFFFLTISCKEDLALLTLFISICYFIIKRERHMLVFAGISLLYLLFIFFLYFPHFVPGGYRYQEHSGLLSSVAIQNLYNTPDKQQILLYSSLWYGLLPFLSPLFLLPPLLDLAKYTILSNSTVSMGQSLFGHYRVSLAILLVLPTIFTLGRFKKLNSSVIAIYILLCAFILQYYLHLPLSYLGKKWFWTTPTSVKSINTTLASIPATASLVTQVNILPHVSERTNIFTLWPQKKTFTQNSPCGEKECHWLAWEGNPQYLLVDTAPDWDARYWLENRNEFVDALQNLEKKGVITPFKRIGTTILYNVSSRL